MKKQSLLYLILLLGSTTFAQLPVSGLVAFYPFTGNANDASGNGHNGTVYGATLTTDRFGNAGSAYVFDGITDSIILNLNQLNITGYSISAWFKTLRGGMVVSGRGVCDNTGLSLVVNDTLFASAGLPMFVCDGPGISIGQTAVTRYDDNSWHHLVGVFDGSPGAIQPNQFTIYVDGSVVSTTSNNAGSSSAPVNQSLNMLIGAQPSPCWGGYGAGKFTGSIDDVGIWDRALTQQEVTEIYTDSCSCIYNAVAGTINWNNGNVQEITLAADRSLTFNNGNSGAIYSLIIKQDGTGGKAIIWPSNVKWPGGTVPVLTGTSNSVDLVKFIYDGTNYLGYAPAQDFR